MPDFNQPQDLAVPASESSATTLDTEIAPPDVPVDGTELKRLVMQDIDDRRDWSEQQRKWRRVRLGLDRKQKLPYPGAPDLLEPIIDDNACALTSAENSIMWSSRVLATFLPLDAQAMPYKRVAERGFDTLLRITLDCRAKIENLFDVKNERGMSIAKLVVNDTALPGELLPDFEPLDPLDVVVPKGTRKIRDADRVTHIIRYTEREFTQEALKRGWTGWEQVLDQLSVREKRSGGELPEGDEYGVSRSRGGGKDTEKSSQAEVCVWETYHWQTQDGAAPKKRVTVMCPDFPEIVMHDADWRWPDVVTPVPMPPSVPGQMPGVAVSVTPGAERAWPFVQFRFENRALGYYDVRGVAEKLLDSQKEATSNKNAKALVMDYCAKPFLKGDKSMFTSFRFRPGDVLPNGAELVIPPRVDPVFDYNMDLARAGASRRVGAPQGALSSVDRTRDAKTATEVSQSAVNSNMLSSDAVERFCEPLGELFNQMWEYLKNNPPSGGLVAVEGQNVMDVPVECFKQRFLIIPGVSGRSANPDLILRQLGVIAQLLTAFPQAGQFIKGADMAAFLFDQIDPKLTPNLIAMLNGPAPIEQQVAQIGQMLMGANGQPGLMQRSQSMQQYLTAMAQHDAGEGKQPGKGPQTDQQKIMNRAPAQMGRPMQPGGMQ